MHIHIQLWIIYRCWTNWFNEIRLWLQIWRLRDLEIRGDGHDKLWSALGDYENAWCFPVPADQELWCQLRPDQPTKEKCVCIHAYDWDAMRDFGLQGGRYHAVWERGKWRVGIDRKRAWKCSLFWYCRKDSTFTFFSTYVIVDRNKTRFFFVRSWDKIRFRVF